MRSSASPPAPVASGLGQELLAGPARNWPFLGRACVCVPPASGSLPWGC